MHEKTRYPKNQARDAAVISTGHPNGTSLHLIAHTLGGEVVLAPKGQDALRALPTGEVLVQGQVSALGRATFSDAQLKDEVLPLGDGLGKVKALTGVSYRWKGKREQGRQIGFIAQDVAKVFPEVVRQSPDGYYAVGYEELAAGLIEAVKQLDEKKRALDARIADARKRLSILEGR